MFKWMTSLNLAKVIKQIYGTENDERWLVEVDWNTLTDPSTCNFK